MSPEISELTSFLNELEKHLSNAYDPKNLGKEDEEKKFEEDKVIFTKMTKRLRIAYECFIEAGFTEQQAWEMFLITYKKSLE